MTTILFSEEETKQIEEILQIYYFVKELLLFSEKIDIDTFPQVINELRNGFDHFSRVLAYKLGKGSVEENNAYVLKNLDKTLGHVYRATYDCLDWMSLVLIEEISSKLESLSEETNEYYLQFMPKILKYEEDIARLRVSKDVANISTNPLSEYTKIVNDLASMKTQLF